MTNNKFNESLYHQTKDNQDFPKHGALAAIRKIHDLNSTSVEHKEEAMDYLLVLKFVLRILVFRGITPNDDDLLEFSPHFQSTENGNYNKELERFVKQTLKTKLMTATQSDETLSLALWDSKVPIGTFIGTNPAKVPKLR